MRLSYIPASSSVNILTFKNATILINPGVYSDRYFISSFGTDLTLTGSRTEVVVPGLTYWIDTGANVAGSNFYFDLTGSGQISLPAASAASATASAGTLIFKNTNIQVDPLAYTGRYYLTSHSPNSFTGLQTIVEVPGLIYGLDNESFVLGSYFYFTVDAAGQITNIIDPVTALPSTSLVVDKWFKAGVANMGGSSGVAV